MTDPRRLAFFGLGDLLVGVVLWLTVSPPAGIAFVVAGIGVLVVAAVRYDPDAADDADGDAPPG